jgi:hypothetical protein
MLYEVCTDGIQGHLCSFLSKTEGAANGWVKAPKGVWCLCQCPSQLQHDAVYCACAARRHTLLQLLYEQQHWRCAGIRYLLPVGVLPNGSSGCSHRACMCFVHTALSIDVHVGRSSACVCVCVGYPGFVFLFVTYFDIECDQVLKLVVTVVFTP